ncbi:MAG: aminotransferase class III-fold pyridoxal phosphate-dependent enzyme, partial [bacterium]
MGLAERDANVLVRGDAIVPIEMKSADGVMLKGADGRSYIDFLSGWCVVNAGWGRKEIMDVLHKFSEPAYTYPTMFYEGWAELAELLAGITPVRDARCLRATGGSEAVEM